MQFVNMTNRNVYTHAGMISPGGMSTGRDKIGKSLEETLSAIIGACKAGIGIRLSKREGEMLNRLMELDEIGSNFNPDSIPSEIRSDPLGIKRASNDRRKAQEADLEATAERNRKSANREALINGETIRSRDPVGPATMKGKTVDPSMLKSGFERILEENARIESGKAEKISDDEILDPIGAHAMSGENYIDNAGSASGDVGIGDLVGEARPVDRARNLQDDATRTADAEPPKAEAPGRKNKMDEMAADMAEKISTIGPSDDAAGGDKQKKTRGRGRKNSKSLSSFSVL